MQLVDFFKQPVSDNNTMRGPLTMILEKMTRMMMLMMMMTMVIPTYPR